MATCSQLGPTHWHPEQAWELMDETNLRSDQDKGNPEKKGSTLTPNGIQSLEFAAFDPEPTLVLGGGMRHSQISCKNML